MVDANSLRLRKVLILEKTSLYTFWVKDLVNGNETEMRMSAKLAMNYYHLKPGGEVYALKSHQEDIKHYRLEIKPGSEKFILDEYLKKTEQN